MRFFVGWYLKLRKKYRMEKGLYSYTYMPSINLDSNEVYDTNGIMNFRWGSIAECRYYDALQLKSNYYSWYFPYVTLTF